MLKKFQILGYSAGVPTQDRGVTCLMISTNQYDVMIDCGEGSYLHWQKEDYKWKNLQYILITHMHPDHIGGLFPFLFYRKIFDIISPLTLIGPPNLEAYLLDSFSHAGINFNQKIKFVNIAKTMNIKLKGQIQIQAMKMEHKIPCWGYALNDENKKLTFITDTRKNKKSIKLSKNSNILIHEATYENKNLNKAHEHFHSTEIQAMEIADMANVERLVLTHFSQRLSNQTLKRWIWKGQPCVIFDERQVI